MKTPPTFDSWDLFVACAPGLEPWLARELAALGFDAEAVTGGAELRTDRAGCYRVLLGCQLGLSVRLRMAQFRTTHFAHLEKQLQQLPWASWLPGDVPLRVKASARRSRLYHSGAIEERVQRVVGRALGSPEPEADTTAGLTLHARMDHDRCQLSLDLCGEPLHRRGYRTRSGKAPLREDLAAALLIAAGYDGGQVLVDPMCGAGTIPIEAALMASGRAPGGRRGFALERLPLHRPEELTAARAGLDRGPPQSPAAPRCAVLGSDRDAGAVDAAGDNARRAGLEGALELTCSPLSECPVPPISAPADAQEGRAAPAGLIVTNPPYGHRIGHRGALRNLYASLGALRRRAGDAYRLALVTSEPSLAHATGIPLEPVVLTDAGGLKVRIYVETTAAATGA